MAALCRRELPSGEPTVQARGAGCGTTMIETATALTGAVALAVSAQAGQSGMPGVAGAPFPAGCGIVTMPCAVQISIRFATAGCGGANDAKL
jgi:hypothetical protein